MSGIQQRRSKKKINLQLDQLEDGLDKLNMDVKSPIGDPPALVFDDQLTTDSNGGPTGPKTPGSPGGVSPVWKGFKSPILSEESWMKCRSCGWTNTVTSNWVLRIGAKCKKCHDRLYNTDQRVWKTARKIILSKRVFRKLGRNVKKRKQMNRKRRKTIVRIED